MCVGVCPIQCMYSYVVSIVFFVYIYSICRLLCRFVSVVCVSYVHKLYPTYVFFVLFWFCRCLYSVSRIIRVFIYGVQCLVMIFGITFILVSCCVVVSCVWWLIMLRIVVCSCVSLMFLCVCCSSVVYMLYFCWCFFLYCLNVSSCVIVFIVSWAIFCYVRDFPFRMWVCVFLYVVFVSYFLMLLLLLVGYCMTYLCVCLFCFVC